MTTLSQDQKQLVQEKAKAIRVSIVQSVTAAKSGHPGGSLSIADVMSLLYFVEMNVDPANPNKQDRDRFVLSKGHAAPALYATLAEKGYFPKSELLVIVVVVLAAVVLAVYTPVRRILMQPITATISEL